MNAAAFSLAAAAPLRCCAASLPLGIDAPTPKSGGACPRLTISCNRYTNKSTIDPSNKMTTTAKSQTTPQLLADLHAGQTKIASSAESYKVALAEKQAEFKSFQANPSAVPVSEAVRINRKIRRQACRLPTAAACGPNFHQSQGRVCTGCLR